MNRRDDPQLDTPVPRDELSLDAILAEYGRGGRQLAPAPETPPAPTPPAPPPPRPRPPAPPAPFFFLQLTAFDLISWDWSADGFSSELAMALTILTGTDMKRVV